MESSRLRRESRGRKKRGKKTAVRVGLFVSANVTGLLRRMFTRVH